MSILDDPLRLAKLLVSINMPSSVRPLGPVDTALEISKVLKDLKGDRKELVKRLPISNEIIKQFLDLLKLPAEVQDMVTWGKSKPEIGSIGFSVASRISNFEPQDIRKIVGTILENPHPIKKDEIKGILSMKKYNPEKSIDECISEVLNVTRPHILHHFVFISGLKPNIAKNLKKSSVALNQNTHEFASSILRRIFPHESLQSIKVFEDCVRILLSKDGRDYITKYSIFHGILRKDAINHIFESEGFLR